MTTSNAPHNDYLDRVSVSLRDENDHALNLQEVEAQIRRLEALVKKVQRRITFYKRNLERQVSVSEETEALIKTGLSLFKLDRDKQGDA